MENLQELLFELSSNERMGIMMILRDESLKLSDLSRRICLTNPETLRQLRRLSDVELIQREPSGLYEISVYGERAQAD